MSGRRLSSFFKQLVLESIVSGLGLMEDGLLVLLFVLDLDFDSILSFLEFVCCLLEGGLFRELNRARTISIMLCMRSLKGKSKRFRLFIFVGVEDILVNSVDEETIAIEPYRNKVEIKKLKTARL